MRLRTKPKFGQLISPPSGVPPVFLLGCGNWDVWFSPLLTAYAPHPDYVGIHSLSERDGLVWWWLFKDTPFDEAYENYMGLPEPLQPCLLAALQAHYKITQ